LTWGSIAGFMWSVPIAALGMAAIRALLAADAEVRLIVVFSCR